MIKSFLILISFQISLFCSQQIVLVVADDINSTHAKLECFEGAKHIFSEIDVNLGRNGLALGLGENTHISDANTLKKYEGDGRAPIGIFKLTNIFAYDADKGYFLPYLYASKDLICVDDSNSPFYNKIIKREGNEKSFEFMRRDDAQYRLGIVVAHNTKAVKKRGSCIFLHVEKFKGATTAGCTSMSYKDLKKIANWLDKKKNPLLIQIPKSSIKKVLLFYPELQNSGLLKDSILKKDGG